MPSRLFLIIDAPLASVTPMPAVLAFLCCGVLCGERSLLAIAQWGQAHQAWCCTVFGFRDCTPCVSTLHCSLRHLDIGAFETALRASLEPQLAAPAQAWRPDIGPPR